MTTHLLHISGGLDSVYVLWNWITNPANDDNTILLHHVNLRHTVEDRLAVERDAVKEALDYFEGEGHSNFIYHESSFDYGTLPRVSIKDIQIVSVFSSVILKTYKDIDTLLLSWHKGEVNREDINKGYRVRAMLKTLEVDREINFSFPIENMTRKDMVERLPDALLKIVRSCRTPKNGIPCGICKTCKEYIEEGLRCL